MKKNIIFILIFIFLLIPCKIKAVSIKDTTFTGVDSVSTGKYFSLTFNINFSNLSIDNKDSLGILALGYEIEFDDSILVLNNIKSNGFNSNLYTFDGKYYVISELNMEDITHKCQDNFLYCSDYSAVLNFYLTNTDEVKTNIKIGDIEVSLYDIESDEINENDVILLEGVSNKNKTLSLYKSSTLPKEEPKTIVKNEEPKIDYEKILTQDRTVSTRKSNINYLDSITIENYPIDFLKSKNDYDITITPDVNELKIDVKLSDSNATYKIIGADDLKGNDYKVIIEVTAEDGSKNIYTINAKTSNDLDETVKIDETKKENTDETIKKTENFKIDKKYIKIGVIIITLIVVISIVVGIISFINGKKIDKELDKF